jgi:hypothetical protein
MPTPGITLTATLQDLSGIADVGSALIITLCGFGQSLPRIAGTSMLARIGPRKYTFATGIASIPLWGNDVIAPSNTYYSVAVMDDKNNVVQCGAYKFTGTGTQDLSTATQIIPPPPTPPPPGPNGVITEIPFTSPNSGNFTIAHGLDRVPRSVNIAMTSAGLVWQQAGLRFDALNIYLTASATGLTGIAIALT